VDSNGVALVFVRRPDGSFATYQDPAASTAPGEGTAAFAVNLLGAVTGEFNDENTVMHGFECFRDGSFANFDVPSAGTGAWQGTRPSTNNFKGEVAGWYVDNNGVNHGFVWEP
jgi:hypothetical protein